MVETFGHNLLGFLGPFTGVERQFKALAPGEFRFWVGMIASVVVAHRLCLILGTSHVIERIHSHASAVLDYKYAAVRRLLTLLIVGPAFLSALVMGHWGAQVLVAWLGPGPGWEPGVGALVVFGGINLLMFDTGHYLSHTILHRVPFFWELHKVHHSAEVLTPVTAERSHPVEQILDALLESPLQGLGLAAFYYLYGFQYSLTAFVGMSAIAFLQYFLEALRHSHAWVSFGPTLEHIFSSPAQHQIHHSTAPQHLNKNLSHYFSFLDWLGGTLYVPKGRETLEFGMGEGSDPELTTVYGLLWVPLKRAFLTLPWSRSRDCVRVVG